MKCPDKECGHEFDKVDADHTVETSIDSDQYCAGEVEVEVSVKVSFCCPDCGEEVEEHEGSSNATVEVELC